FAAAVFVPSASVTLVAQAQPFNVKDVEIQAQAGTAPIKVRSVVIAHSNSQGFKVTGSIDVPLAPAIGTVFYTNNINKPGCPGLDCGSPGIKIPYGQRLMNTNNLEFAQTTPDVIVPWKTASGPGVVQVWVIAVKAGPSGNVGHDTITQIEGNPYDQLSVDNPQATG